MMSWFLLSRTAPYGEITGNRALKPAAVDSRMSGSVGVWSTRNSHRSYAKGNSVLFSIYFEPILTSETMTRRPVATDVAFKNSSGTHRFHASGWVPTSG